jgi:hypothetical protein
MKEFNLEAALNGEPVMLRNGKKAIIYYCTPAEFKFDENIPDTFPLKGMVFDEKGYLEDPLVTWRCNGSFRYSEDDWDIIGMWEEPKISIKDLPKPFKPKNGESYYYICGRAIEYVYKYAEISPFNRLSSENGQCFRTREDAQKWLDFMKSMME